MRILHVTESYGGGVITAIESYIENSSDLEHYGLVHIREEDPSVVAEAKSFKEAYILPSNKAKYTREIRKTVKLVDPDVIHLHSSWAGFFGRIALSGSRRSIVYTPHGYAFERKDVHKWKLRIFWLMEKALSRNKVTIAACSPRETELAKKMQRKVVYLPNTVRANTKGDTTNVPSDTKTIGILGRITAARDPRFVLELCKSLESIPRPDRPKIIWIGGGNEHEEKLLRDVGVEITGWLSHRDALMHIDQCSAIIHPAAWDGFPMAVLESAGRGLPIIVRDIDAFNHLPIELKARSVEEMRDKAFAVINDEFLRRVNTKLWEEALEPHSPENQANALALLYKPSNDDQ